MFPYLNDLRIKEAQEQQADKDFDQATERAV